MRHRGAIGSSPANAPHPPSDVLLVHAMTVCRLTRPHRDFPRCQVRCRTPEKGVSRSCRSISRISPSFCSVSPAGVVKRQALRPRSTAPDGPAQSSRSALSLGPVAFKCLITYRSTTCAVATKNRWRRLSRTHGAHGLIPRSWHAAPEPLPHPLPPRASCCPALRSRIEQGACHCPRTNGGVWLAPLVGHRRMHALFGRQLRHPARAFMASSAMRAVKPAPWFRRFRIPDLLVLGDQKTSDRGFRYRTMSGRGSQL